jgi:ribosome maturation factor RimP
MAQVNDLICDFLNKNNFYLVQINNFYQGNNLFIRILIDKPQGGISIDECARLNSQIGEILDEKNILQQRYVLEVSSPGLDRPLATKEDFLRCINKEARLFFSQLINGKREVEGVISKVDGDCVYIDTGEGLFEAPLSKITKAKQVIK